MKTIKIYLQRFCLVFVGFFVAFMFAEGVVRVFYPHSRDHVVPSGLFEMDDYLGWKLAAEKKVVHHSQYFEAIYQTNALGYRDKPRDIAKAPQRGRILVYGDSQIFGWGVSAEQRFSDLIEAQTPRWQLWNLAAPGYGLDQEILSYEKQGSLFNADEVVFFVSEATLARIRYDYIYKKHKPKFVFNNNELTLKPVGAEANAWSNLLYRVFSPFYLPYFIERRLAMLKQTSKPADDETGKNDNSEWRALGELEKRILDRAKNLATERGHKMTALTDLPKTSRMSLKKFCQERGIGYLEIDLSEGAHIRFGKEDSHWTPEAHRLIAKQLLSALQTRIPTTAERQ
jgi:hypothetical protein